MNAKIKVSLRNRGVVDSKIAVDKKKCISRIRAGISLALLSVLLGACSSVPTAINPVKWYEKTTDFFSGDAQATQSASNQGAGERTTQDKGLSADSQAPAPAPRPRAPAQVVAAAPGGLNASSGADRQYAGPPLERQGAARDVLPREEMASIVPSIVPSAVPKDVPRVALNDVPLVAPDAVVAVVPTPPTPTPPTLAPPTLAPTPPTPAPVSQPPIPPAQPTVKVTAAPSAAPVVATPEEAPVPARPLFGGRVSPGARPPANAATPFGEEAFKTVVISADGLDTAPQTPRPRANRDLEFSALKAATQPQVALFPKPGEPVARNATPERVGGMLRVATIHFANNSDRLDGRDRSILGAVVQLQRERGGRVVVVGHASQRTRDMDYIRHQMVNFKISMERADTVGNALESMGLRGNLLEVQAVSDAKPLYLEVMPSGEAGNRRVEVYLAP